MELRVTGMTCGGCVASVKRALARVEPTAEIEVELSTGRVVLRRPEAAGPGAPDRARVVQAIVQAGFGVEES